MKIGCAAWCFTHPHYAPPYEDAIKTIGRLGLQGLELIAFTIEDLQTYYTKARVKELRKLYSGYGLMLSEFVLYSYLVEGLLGKDPIVKTKAMDVFKKGLEISQDLGATIINMVSNWPPELKAPIAYPPTYIHPNVNGVQLFDPKLRMDLPANFNAPEVWNTYIDSLARMVELASAAGMRLALEGHAQVIVGTTDAFLRAADRIPSPSFGTNLDVAWQFLQREYVPWSIYKLRERILHVHVRDGDGLFCYNLPPGNGVIDWNGVVRALKEVGYDGFLSFELSGYLEPERYVKQGKEYLERVLQEEGAAT